MLTLNLNEGEYITVGDNIVIQAYPEGKRVTLRVDAPREIPVLRGSVQEKRGAPKPEALAQAGERKSRAKAKSMGQQLRSERYFEKVDRWQARKDAARDAFETMERVLAGMEPGETKRVLQEQLDRLFPLTE